ncbi:MAG: hypothetical protein LBO20_10215 [Bifidobacteriaceae bacterium]|jgi:hypothetical protein|nr:hypothetical protein [Bifidobacteriaceae bacterium]
MQSLFIRKTIAIGVAAAAADEGGPTPQAPYACEATYVASSDWYLATDNYYAHLVCHFTSQGSKKVRAKASCKEDAVKYTGWLFKAGQSHSKKCWLGPANSKPAMEWK